MKKFWFTFLTAICLTVLSGPANAEKDDEVTLKASLNGANEVPPIFTAGTGRFSATIHSNGSIDFTLTFSDLTSNLSVSHIHFAQPNVAGGVMIFLCGGGGQPACPAATAATVTGTITPANVVGPTAQGIAVGDLAAALKVIGAGEGYVNVHTTNFPGGEIRGQVKVRKHDRGHDDDDDDD